MKKINFFSRKIYFFKYKYIYKIIIYFLIVYKLFLFVLFKLEIGL